MILICFIVGLMLIIFYWEIKDRLNNIERKIDYEILRKVEDKNVK